MRQQLAVLKRTTKRPALTKADRVFWVTLSRLWTGWQHALILVKPETVIGVMGCMAQSRGEELFQRVPVEAPVGAPALGAAALASPAQTS